MVGCEQWLIDKFRMYEWVMYVQIRFFFSSRRRHTRCREVSWARRCVQETVFRSIMKQNVIFRKSNNKGLELSQEGEFVRVQLFSFLFY
eukprot:TRINITY_DN15968_c0_g1_i1.p3 TRINITY_DN15968_c0_g1~~TRINITY_DN15968_c0_g1_i1.p3  ORF type:complete len:101 (-),score=10.85 TRINITY_DN15968_c0_g1_i1:809-1075(-)